jgi:hypothetical protein
VSGAQGALEAALLAMMADDADVAAAFGSPLRVKTEAGDRPACPFLEIVRHECADAGAAGVEGSDHQVDLQVQFRDGLRVHAAEAMAAVRGALSRPAPAMEGWRCVTHAAVFWDLMPVRFGGWRGMVRVRAVLERV